MTRKFVMLLILTLAVVFTIIGFAQASAVIPEVFNSNSLPGNDDDSTGLVPIGFPINFFGTTYTDLYVNNNGNVTFVTPLSTCTPHVLTTDLGTSIIAPFFADVDTRVGNILTYGQGAWGDRSAFGVNWIDVGYYDEHTDKLNTFQLILVDRSDVAPGDFDIIFNYDKIQWETGDDCSGGIGGLGGNSAHVGYSKGTGNSGTFNELPGSGVNGAFLDGGPHALISFSNIGVPGRYLFEVRNGIPPVTRYDITPIIYLLLD
jgi:Nidogen-like